ncbi:hypothetical protein [Aquibacillus rhizosphaerae]|uniref:Resolvase HTH domain-containing protein n=1 Tax=Aquibacillus rhizosphaerae TaxID=3051431 RepID=A0ABT7L6Q5_9BACI|nr:hypothetical protein [Aquibacillus sp. LR5S19]MDL4841542.1 hypothetical protein [Aquibacillus sp. LR5S19]
MISALISIATIGLLLIILSFFMNDKFKQMEEQVEQISITTLQESYQMKKKIKILEEELLSEDLSEPEFRRPENNQSPLMRKINHLYKQGATIKEIAIETKLSEYDVHSIVNQLSKER